MTRYSTTLHRVLRLLNFFSLGDRPGIQLGNNNAGSFGSDKDICRERERERERERDRQRGRETETERQRQRERERGRQTDRERQRETEKISNPN